MNEQIEAPQPHIITIGQCISELPQRLHSVINSPNFQHEGNTLKPHTYNAELAYLYCQVVGGANDGEDITVIIGDVERALGTAVLFVEDARAEAGENIYTTATIQAHRRKFGMLAIALTGILALHLYFKTHSKPPAATPSVGPVPTKHHPDGAPQNPQIQSK
jgi:hypothetical protein